MKWRIVSQQSSDTVRCNYLSLPSIPASGTHVLKWCFTYSIITRTYINTSNYSITSNLTRRLNILRPIQNGRRFPDDIFKYIFLNENVWISIKISLMFVPKGPINNIPALVQIMAWCRPGDKPLSEAMVVNLPTHICVSRRQWVN